MYLKVNEVDRAFEKLQEANLKISKQIESSISYKLTVPFFRYRAEYELDHRLGCNLSNAERKRGGSKYVQVYSQHTERRIRAMEQHRNVFLSEEQTDCRNFLSTTANDWNWFLYFFPFISSRQFHVSRKLCGFVRWTSMSCITWGLF